MKLFTILVQSSQLSPSASSLPDSPILQNGQRQGNTCYWQSDIDAALNKGYSLYSSGKEEDSYPHQYNDYEGFNFPTSAPWYEFPILNSFDVYTGGSPGADRVIFDSDGNFDSVITHTGASGDDFVACQQ
ncbi:ribonuclease domain-containing protein [Trichoderma sp. SZMC 28014]